MSDVLCRVIRDAFAGVTLGDGVGLHQGQGLDDYASPEACARLRERDELYDWRNISAADLNECHSSLSFFDAEGMRFHLPAFLCAELRGEFRFGMAFALTHLSDYCVTQFALLNAVQRQAVRAFLLHIAESAEYEYDRPEIVRALDEYWTL